MRKQKYTLSDCYKRGSSRVNKKRRTPIPLLGLQIAIFNAHPSKAHKDALANMRSDWPTL